MKPFTDGRGSPLGAATDGELFALMAKGGDAGHLAWDEFCQRYAKDFHKILCRVPGLSDDEADDLAQETMIRAYKRAETFKPHDHLPKEQVQHLTLGWLGSIARNMRYGEWRRKKNAPVSEIQSGAVGSSLNPEIDKKIPPGELKDRIREAEEQIGSESVASQEYVSPQRQLLRDALASLDERERDVYLTSHDYYDRDKKHPHLPRAVVNELCERHKIKPDYLRKLRERAHKKVLQYIQANSPTRKKR